MQTEFYDTFLYFFLVSNGTDRTKMGDFLPMPAWVVGAPTVTVVPSFTGLSAVVVGLPTVAGFPIFVSKVPELASLPLLELLLESRKQELSSVGRIGLPGRR
jgi:hypothetical protein